MRPETSVYVAPLAVAARPDDARNSEVPAMPAALRLAAAASLLAAAALHAMAAASHTEHWPIAGNFFTALQLVQTWLGLALLLNFRVTAAARATLAVNGTTLLLWVVTRTLGLPVGPEAGVAEPTGQLDVAVSLLQVAGIAATALLLRRGPATALLHTPTTVAVVIASVILLLIWGAAAPGSTDQPAGHVLRTSHNQPDS